MNRGNKIYDENFRSLVHLIKVIIANSRKVEHIISYYYNEFYHKGYENAKSELPL